MTAKSAIFLAIIYSNFLSVKSEIFTSTEILKDVFLLEKKVTDFLSANLRKRNSEEMQTKIEKYLRDYEQVKLEAKTSNKKQQEEYITSDMEILAENPIQVFLLFKRLSLHQDVIKSYITKYFWEGLDYTVMKSKVYLPNDEDIEGAATSLIRLQSVYKINVSELADGNILGVQSSAVLSAQDCYDLGKRAFIMGLYFNAAEWLVESFDRAESEVDSTISQNKVLKILKKAVALYDEQNPNANFGRRLIGGVSVPERELQGNRKSRLIGKMEDLFENYEALCRGEALMSEGAIAELKCFYDGRGSSYFTLMPIKVEVRHLEPEILLFHDVLSLDEILRLKIMAKPKLSRGIIQGRPDQNGTPSVSRISQVAWMDAHEDPLLISIERRIEMLTGLRTDLREGSSEILQVANYGTGGHYNLHYDYLFVEDSTFEKKLRPRELELGDRVATFMFYASNVQRGGATAFPYLGASVMPTQGSAAFWYNLKDSWRGDERTLHGACPVVYGSKWVVNKWIREKGQVMKRKYMSTIK